MELHTAAPLTGARLERVRAFLQTQGLRMGEDAGFTVLLQEEGRVLGTGSLCGNVLKYIAVDPALEGQGACAQLVSELVGEAYRQGRTHLFLYTKPETAPLFSSLGFYPVIKTRDMAMLESRKGGLEAYLAGLQRGQGVQGACVMNASPFTLGHRYLLETAARQVDTLHVFIVSQDNGPFSPALRREMAQAGAADIPNILWQDCGSYLVSAATFPTYFIKDRARAEDAQADLDIALFAQKIAPTLSITRRFVGTEPFCPITARYNQRMAEELPRYGIQLIQLPRKDAISASRVRAAMAAENWEEVRRLVPPSTYARLRSLP